MGKRLTQQQKDRLARIDRMTIRDYENWQKWARRNNKTMEQAIDATIAKERRLRKEA